MSKGRCEGYIIEYVTVGKSVKVTAFDPITLTEAIIIGDKKTPQDDLAKIAVRKLEYIMQKNMDD